MSIYRFVIRFTHFAPHSTGYLADARALGFHDLRRIERQDIFFIEGQLSSKELQQLAFDLFTDPVTQSAVWTELPSQELPHFDLEPDTVTVEVSPNLGVTDPVAHEIVRAAHELGIKGVHQAATGLRFLLQFELIG